MSQGLPEVTAALPPMYNQWIVDILSQPIPNETKATCMDCPMCTPQNRTTAAHDVVFNAKTKCCTYHPDLPNFLVGKILKDTQSSSDEGPNRLRSRLRAPAVIRPQGVFPSLQEAAKNWLWNPGFGHDESMLCPYFLQEQGGVCGIWMHRNARCATWYCKHTRGAIGLGFWRTLKELLTAVEQHLSIWCVHSLEAGSLRFRELFPPPGIPNLELFQQQQAFYHRTSLPRDMISDAEAFHLKHEMWGPWLGREALFFRECSSAVASLDWAQVAAIGKEFLVHHADRLRQAFSAMVSGQIPSVLKPASYRSAALSPGMVRVWGYSFYDPLDLSADVLDALLYFDGRTTESAIAWIAENTNVQLTKELVRKLCDYGILEASRDNT